PGTCFGKRHDTGGRTPCSMRTAVYTQESGYVLRFRPVSEPQVAMSTNAFHIEAPDRDRQLLGTVTWNNGESRPTGSTQHDCPEDAYPRRRLRGMHLLERRDVRTRR